MKYFGPRLITQNELPDGYYLAVPEDELGRFYVLDSEGEPLFRVPESLEPEMTPYENDAQWFACLVAVAKLVEDLEGEAYLRGVDTGRRYAYEDLQRALGLDSLKKIADELGALRQVYENFGLPKR